MKVLSAFTDEEIELELRRRSRLQQKFGIMHPSDRPLGLRYDGVEVWGQDFDDRLVLFDTQAEAQAYIDARTREYPKGDWKHAKVARYTPGRARVYPTWETSWEPSSETNS